MPYLSNNGSRWWEMSNNNELTMAIVAISVVVILAIVWYKKPITSPSLPPGPRSLPILGYLPFLRPELHKQLTTMGQIYGPIFKLYLGNRLHVVINDLDLLKAVVRDKDETFSNHHLTIAASVVTYGGRDVLFSNKSYWRNLRKILVHDVLSKKNLEACVPLIREDVRKTINNVYTKIGTEIDIGEVSFTAVTGIISKMINGAAGSSSDDDEEETHIKQMAAELKTVAENIFEVFAKPNVSDFIPSIAWFDVQGIERHLKKQHKKLDRIFTTMIEERIKSNSKKSVGEIGKKDFLEVLIDLKNQKQIDDTQMKTLMLDLIFAGTETTATVIEWAMAEILKNQDVLKMVQEELAQVVGVNNIVGESHLSNLQYLDATIKETLRLHPLAPFLNPRSPHKDCIIGGYTIPKDCTLFLNVWAIHRDPQHWKNPLEFNPERFLFNHEWTNETFDLKGNNLKFLPFGSGRRICPGISLANKLDMYILASLLHSFNWSLPSDQKHDLSDKFSLSLKKQKPLMIIASQKLPNTSLYM